VRRHCQRSQAHPHQLAAGAVLAASAFVMDDGDLLLLDGELCSRAVHVKIQSR